MRQIFKTVFAILVPVSLVTCHHDNLKDVAPVLPKKPNILWIVAEDLSPIIPPFGDEKTGIQKLYMYNIYKRIITTHTHVIISNLLI